MLLENQNACDLQASSQLFIAYTKYSNSFGQGTANLILHTGMPLHGRLADGRAVAERQTRLHAFALVSPSQEKRIKFSARQQLCNSTDMTA